MSRWTTVQTSEAQMAAFGSVLQETGRLLFGLHQAPRCHRAGRRRQVKANMYNARWTDSIVWDETAHK